MTGDGPAFLGSRGWATILPLSASNKGPPLFEGVICGSWVIMRRFLHPLFAFLVVLGVTGAELRLPEAPAALCSCGGSGSPCGMPQRSPQPCGTSAPSPLAAPVQPVAAVAEAVASTRLSQQPPRPWSETWAWVREFQAEAGVSKDVSARDPGPPLLASERVARLNIFRI